jgi:hypothetical protein
MLVLRCFYLVEEEQEIGGKFCGGGGLAIFFDVT